LPLETPRRATSQLRLIAETFGKAAALPQYIAT